MRITKDQRKMLDMAQEWANELCAPKYRGHELLVAEVTTWGFGEVERGRHPDIVLREVLAKIEESMPRSVNLSADNPPGNLRSPHQRLD